ncbi:MAG: hypothetical protein ABR985_21360 [Methanotrichaceae archaeon]
MSEAEASGVKSELLRRERQERHIFPREAFDEIPDALRALVNCE